MTLDEFIATKPKELRLGQYFFNVYLHWLKPEDKMHYETRLLYNTADDLCAKYLIKSIMIGYQWEELPDPPLCNF